MRNWLLLMKLCHCNPDSTEFSMHKAAQPSWLKYTGYIGDYGFKISATFLKMPATLYLLIDKHYYKSDDLLRCRVWRVMVRFEFLIFFFFFDNLFLIRLIQGSIYFLFVN